MVILVKVASTGMRGRSCAVLGLTTGTEEDLEVASVAIVKADVDEDECCDLMRGNEAGSRTLARPLWTASRSGGEDT